MDRKFCPTDTTSSLHIGSEHYQAQDIKGDVGKKQLKGIDQQGGDGSKEYRAIKTWNSLPGDLHSALSLSSFRNKLKLMFHQQ